MKKQEMKKMFLRTLIIGGLVFGAVNVVPMQVEAYNSEALDYSSLPYEQFRLIKKYTNIFCLDINQASLFLMEKTNNLQDLNFIEGRNFDTEEEAILTFMYYLAFKPDLLGIEKKTIVRTDNTYEMLLSHEETIYHYSEILGIDPEIALSISYAECGTDLDSSNYRNNNNPAGLGPFMKFHNKEEGIIYYTFLLRDSYKLKEEDNSEFFDCIAGTYCPDDPGHWIKLTSGIYNNVKDDYLFYNEELKEDYGSSKQLFERDEMIAYNITERINEYYGAAPSNTKIKTLRKIKSTNK